MFNTDTQFIVVLAAGGRRQEACIYRVVARKGVDVVEALKIATADYLRTEEGLEYGEIISADRPFGWEDVPVISPDVLVRHGIYLLEEVPGDEPVCVLEGAIDGT